MDEDYAESYAEQLERQKGGSFWLWMSQYLEYRRSGYVIGFIIICLLGWWVNNWFAPIFFLVSFKTVTHIMSKYGHKEPLYVIENRMQGEVIDHGPFPNPVVVPASYIGIWQIPGSRRKDIVRFGDSTPPVPTHSIEIVDYMEKLPSGKILAVFPKDNNFANYAMTARMNGDLAKAMAEVGSMRESNFNLRETVVELFHSGRLAETPQEAMDKLRSILMDVDAVESKLSNTAAAKRDIFGYYKDVIPRQNKALLMNNHELSRRASAETARMLHEIFDHAMGADQRKNIMAMIGEDGAFDYEARMKRLLGNDDEAATKNRSTIHDEAVEVKR